MTKVQHQASNPQSSVWLAASAGTGKTKVLTDRVLRLLLSGVDASHILCLTYTSAAAAEMETRIHSRLSDWVIADDATLQTQLEALTGEPASNAMLTQARLLFATVLDTPQGLKIQTIHAFCQNILSRFPLEAGIAPHTTIMDNQTRHELLSEAKMRLLMARTQDKALAEAIKALACRLHESNFLELLETIINQSIRLGRLLENTPLADVIARVYSALGVQQHETEAQILTDYALDADQTGLYACVSTLFEGGKTDQKYGQAIKTWLDSDAEERVIGWEAYQSVFVTQEGKARDKLCSKAIMDGAPHIADTLAEEQQRILAALEHIRSVRTASFTHYVLRLSHALLEHYHQLKTRYGYMDFNDVIYSTRKLLTESVAMDWVLYKLDNGIDHILVDEAQDTSPDQWHIITQLLSEFFAGESIGGRIRTLFVVGDEKQSIYRFQGADPKMFQTMQATYETQALQSNALWQSLSLDMSFRSTEAVLTLVDAICAHPVLKPYLSPTTAVIHHHVFRTNQPGIIELWPVIEAETQETVDPWPLPITRRHSQDPATRVAEQIAETIHHWRNSKRPLASRGRPVEPGDIMILVRRRNHFVDAMVRALKQRNIPVAGTDRLVLTDHIAIMDLIALGEFLLFPQDDLTLATLLKTPLIGLSEEALFTLAHDRGKESLWSRLIERQAEYPQAYSYLHDLLQRVDAITPFELYSYVLDIRAGRTDFIARMGDEVNDPFDEFLDLALTYEQSHTASLQGFLHWLKTSPVEIKRDMEQSSNEVRIMTVHGAKGLQAPIVFLPDTTQMPYNKPGEFIWQDDLFFWPGGRANENALCTTLRTAQSQEQTEEYYRLLYVALTRAEDELYIAGWQGTKKRPDGCWYTILENVIKRS